jgi:outer membrane protein assembly factor BamB
VSTRRVVAAVILVLAVGAGGAVRSRSAGAMSPNRGRVAAFDLVTGALRFAVESPTASVHIHALGDGVVVLSGADSCHDYPYAGESMFALSLARGDLRWKRTLLGACFDYGAPTPTTRGVVPVQLRRGVAAWNTRDGSTRWRNATLQEPTGSTDAVLSVNSNTGDVKLVDPLTGRVRVTAAAPHKPTTALVTPAVVVLVTQSDSTRLGWTERLTAVDTHTGRRLWQRTLGRFYEWSERAGSGEVVALTWSTTSTTTMTEAFAVGTGRRLWVRADSAPFDDAIVATGAGLALAFEDGRLVALDLRTGRLRWRAAIRRGAVVAGDGSVAVVRRESVSMLDAGTGAVRWTKPLPKAGVAWSGSAAIGAGVLVVPATSPAYKPYVE